jgi:hypothetical protein
MYYGKVEDASNEFRLFITDGELYGGFSGVLEAYL